MTHTQRNRMVGRIVLVVLAVALGLFCAAMPTLGHAWCYTVTNGQGSVVYRGQVSPIDTSGHVQAELARKGWQDGYMTVTDASPCMDAGEAAEHEAMARYVAQQDAYAAGMAGVYGSSAVYTGVQRSGSRGTHSHGARGK